MARILHTSDWHLGDFLGCISREQDHQLFIDWLLDWLDVHPVDALVIAGDLFDQMHPAAGAQRQFYQFVAKASQRVPKIVIVGGNHDSPSRLDAPRELLQSFRVHIVGGIANHDSWDRCLCPLALPGQTPSAVVVAVPYVHEFWLGIRTSQLDQRALHAEFQRAFADLYRNLADRAEKIAMGAPLIATGHLTIGETASDAPDPIHHVGSIGGLPSSIFDSRFQYVALGHIHRCGAIEASRVWYSGTPIALSLEEARSPRKMLMVDTDAPPAQKVTPIEIPVFRELVELRGRPSEIKDRVAHLESASPLPPLVFAVIDADHYRSGVELEIGEAAAHNPRGKPIVVRVDRERVVDTSPESLGEQHYVGLADLRPIDVFEQRCLMRGVPLDDRLRHAFESLLVEAETDEEAR